MRSLMPLNKLSFSKNQIIVISRSISFQRRSFSNRNAQLLTKYNSSNDFESKLTHQRFDEAEMMSSRLTKEPYYAKRERESLNQDDESKPSSQAELERFKRIESIKGVLTALTGIIGLITVFTLYQKWPAVKGWYYKMDEDEFKPSKKVKRDISLPLITNQYDSSKPGLYLCGDNSQAIVSDKKTIKEQRYPMRYDWFDGKILKDVQLGEDSALAIDSKGDLIQWGKGFSDVLEPQYTIKGEHLTKAIFSNHAIYALNSNNEVFIIPESAKDQRKFQHGLTQRTWYTLYLTKVEKPFIKLNDSSLSKGEKIVDISAGKFHLLTLSNKGKVYSCATGFKQLQTKSLGQYGLPQFSQFSNPPVPNVLYDVELLNNQITRNSKGKIEQVEPRKIVQIATGWYHSLALDSNGEVYSFGQNKFGQLGHPVNYDSEIIPFPRKIDLLNKHIKRDLFPEVVDIQAGGETSFVTIKPIPMYKLIKGGAITGTGSSDQGEDSFTVGFGNNLKGQIGSGHYVHAQFDPIKVKEINEFQDYNEDTKEMENINIKNWSSGADHTFITLQNNDVLYWGGNDYAQLGNGKKNRISRPTIAPAIIEPSYTIDTYKDLTFSNRLQLKHNQKIVAGETTSAIFYTST